MIREVSKYKNNLVASKKKHIFSRLLDYFSLFVVTYLLFTIFYPIGSATPVVSNITKELSDVNYQIAEYIDSTHLQRLNSDKTSLLSIDDGAAKYVESLCKTSAYVHELTFPVKNESGTYDEVVVDIKDTFINDLTNYPLDSLSYYFKKVKKSETSLNNYVYEGVDYKDDIDTYLYLKLMKVDASKFVSSDNTKLIARGGGVSHFTVLSEENTVSLLRYFKEDRADTSIYDSVFLSFINADKYGISDVEKNSSPYLNLTNDFNRIYQSMTLAILIIYLISYVIANLLMSVIMRLICKEWISLGQKVMGLAMCSRSELEPSVWQLIGYYLLNFIFFVSSLTIAFYFMGMLGVFSVKIFGVISLLSLTISILIFNVISLLFPFFNKNNNDFVAFVCRLLVKDTKEFEGPIEDSIEEKQEETNDGREETTN